MTIDGVVPRSIGRGMAPSAVDAHTVSALLSFGLHVAIVGFVLQATFQPAKIASLPAIDVTLLSEDLPGSPAASRRTTGTSPAAGPRTRPHPPARRGHGDDGVVETRTAPAQPDVTPPPKPAREVEAVRRMTRDETASGPSPPPPPPPPKPVRPAAAPAAVAPSSVATRPEAEAPAAPTPAMPVQTAVAPVAPPSAIKPPQPEVPVAPLPVAFVDVSDTSPDAVVRPSTAGAAPAPPLESASGGLTRLGPGYDKGVPSVAGDAGAAGSGLAAAGAALAGNPPPEYPYLARRRGIEGRVVVGVTVVSDGYPQNVRVIASSGHGILDRAAAEAVRKWKFIAARQRGAPVASSIEVPITFRLED